MSAASDDLRDTLIDIAMSPRERQKLQLEAEWLRMQIKHFETEAGLARQKLAVLTRKIER